MSTLEALQSNASVRGILPDCRNRVADAVLQAYEHAPVERERPLNMVVRYSSISPYTFRNTRMSLSV
jgi:hypothetical protein